MHTNLETRQLWGGVQADFQCVGRIKRICHHEHNIQHMLAYTGRSVAFHLLSLQLLELAIKRLQPLLGRSIGHCFGNGQPLHLQLKDLQAGDQHALVKLGTSVQSQHSLPKPKLSGSNSNSSM